MAERSYVTTGTEQKRRLPFFYGWVIVATSATGRTLGSAMGMSNFGLFIRPMDSELGIPRSTFGWAQAARLIAGAVASPMAGRLIDRFGSRILLACTAALTAAAMLWLANLSQPWLLLPPLVLMGLVPMSGPGGLVTSVPVSKWFIRKRGRAVGWLFLVGSFGGLVTLPLTQLLIDTIGWRNTWIAMAALGAGVIIPMSLLLIRRQPEDVGLAPDGDHQAREPSSIARADEGGEGISGESDETSWTLREAVRSPAFWRVVFVSSIVSLGSTSLHLHRIPHFMDRGLDPQLVAIATGLDFMLSGIATFGMGYLVKKIQVRFLVGLGLAILSISTFLTIIAETPLVLFLAAGTFGIGVGGGLLLEHYLWAEYFGRQHLGSIRGLVNPVSLAFGAVGPPVAGYVSDATGSYNPFWWVVFVALLLGATVLILTPPPQKKLAVSPAPG